MVDKFCSISDCITPIHTVWKKMTSPLIRNPNLSCNPTPPPPPHSPQLQSHPQINPYQLMTMSCWHGCVTVLWQYQDYWQHFIEHSIHAEPIDLLCMLMSRIPRYIIDKLFIRFLYLDGSGLNQIEIPLYMEYLGPGLRSMYGRLCWVHKQAIV